MRVGHAAVELPVPVGTPLGGYAARTGPSTGTRDPLQVCVLALDGLTWVVADLPYVHEDLATAVTARVPGTVWVSATHTHSGPETSCLPSAPTTPPAWLTAVADAAGVAAGAATTGGREVRLELRRTRLSDVGGQRSGARPRRTVPVDTLSFVDDDGSLAGLVVVLPVHPTVLGADNLRVSGDLAGAARRALAARTGAWVVVATGAAGDVSTRPHRRAQTPEECERLGGLVADAVLRGLARPPRAVVPPGTPVVTGDARVPLAAKPPPGSPELIARLEARLARARRGGSPVAERTAYTALQAAQLAAAAPAPPPDPACAVAVAGIGPVSLVALGAEPYLALAERLDARLDAAAVLVGYTNGYLGYLPTRAAYRRSDYEVLRSPVAAGSAEEVLDRAARLAAGTRTHHRKDRP